MKEPFAFEEGLERAIAPGARRFSYELRFRLSGGTRGQEFALGQGC
jgi:recombinational DNA repair protein (RecF pathway)